AGVRECSFAAADHVDAAMHSDGGAVVVEEAGGRREDGIERQVDLPARALLRDPRGNDGGSVVMLLAFDRGRVRRHDVPNRLFWRVGAAVTGEKEHRRENEIE